jgi:hypothetical protein
MTHQLHGAIDGIPLMQFVSGQTYDVGTSVGSYLLAVGAAQPAEEDDGPPIVPLDSSLLEELSQAARNPPVQYEPSQHRLVARKERRSRPRRR